MDSTTGQSPLALETFPRRAGEPVQNSSMFLRAWDECIELQVQARDEWAGKALLSLQGLDRYEVALFDGSDVVGAVCLAQDQWDVHVGQCMSVFAQYVLPEFRGRAGSSLLMRESVRLAKAEGASVLAFTHRKGPWRYETIYHRIKR